MLKLLRVRLSAFDPDAIRRIRLVNSNFLNNGDGIEAGGGTVTLAGVLISGNSRDGVRLLSGNVVFQGQTITGNGGVGVHLEVSAQFGKFCCLSCAWPLNAAASGNARVIKETGIHLMRSTQRGDR